MNEKEEGMKEIKIYKKAVAQLLTACSAAAIIYLFVRTGLGKIFDHTFFSIQMSKQPLPSWAKPILVYLLPCIELGIVGTLCCMRTRMWGFVTASLLMFAYTIYAYLAHKEVYGYVICACGKVFKDMDWRGHFYYNSLYTIIALIGFYFTYRSRLSKGRKQKE